MVTAHGGHLGYHLKLYDNHWKILMVTEGIVDEQAIDTAKQEEYTQLTMDLSCEEFFGCLCVCQSNNKRYGCLKEQQHNLFLMGYNKYTKKMLESKTLLKYWQGQSSANPAPMANKK